MLLVELIFVLAIFVLALTWPRLGDAWLRRAGRRFRAIARRRRLAVAIVGVVAFAMSMLFTLVVHFPQPAVHDEFAYLLGSDTFAQGRLTNPTHPMWEHFESYHIIQQPTYQMKFPPGQSIALAVGQLLGHSIIGVWISWSLACAALCWMLQAWLPPRWALLGAMLPSLNVEMIKWWSQSYWGGAMAMLGGALLFGSLVRLLRRPAAVDAVLLSFGLAILANTRPYEGLVASVPAALVIGAWAISRAGPQARAYLLQVVAPALTVLLLAASWMGYYHYRVTGDPLRMPYQVWQATYVKQSGLAKTILSVGSETADQPLVSRMRVPGETEQSKYRLTVPEIPNSFWTRMLRQWLFYMGPILTISLFSLPRLLRRGRMKLAVLTVVLVLLAIGLQNTSGNPHYAAPVACLIVAIIVQGLRYLRCWKVSDRPIGVMFVRLIVPFLLVTMLVRVRAYRHEPVAPFARWSIARAELLKRLSSDDQLHLVVVRYGDGHHIWHEWVYNEAKIDAAKVVWARELSPDKNRNLLEYFADRQAWLLEADANPPRVTPHRPAGVAPPASPERKDTSR